jgi:single-strand DNA-binding protein
MGNLTRDVELKEIGDTHVANFGIAVNRSYKNREGETVEEVDYFDVEVWGRQAEICDEYLSKGRGVLVDGRLKQDRWEDDDGNKRSKVKVVGNIVVFLPRGGNGDYESDEDGAPQKKKKSSKARKRKGGKKAVPF